MKNFENISATKRNNLRLFFQLSFFALFAIMSLFTGQTSAQQTCTPSTTVTEGDLLPGGLASFAVTSGPGTVTVDHVNAGTGLQSLTVVSATNAVVNIPAFTPGTFNPVVVTFTAIDPALPVDFTLRAASTFHAVFIRARCGTGMPTPTPTPTPRATPTPGATPTPNPTPTPGGATTFSGRATSINATIAGVNAILNDTGPLPATGGFIRRQLVSASLFGGALTTGELDATTQGGGIQSRSQAIVADLNLLVGGITFNSDILAESSQCTCTAGGPVCEGGLFGNLLINGVTVAITGQPNQRVNLAGGGFVIINEQILTGSGNSAAITANGLHIVIPSLTPGTPAVADVIISSAHSDINCGIF